MHAYVYNKEAGLVQTKTNDNRYVAYISPQKPSISFQNNGVHCTIRYALYAANLPTIAINTKLLYSKVGQLYYLTAVHIEYRV